MLKNILHVHEVEDEILKSIEKVKKMERVYNNAFGNGDSSEKFIELLENKEIWEIEIAKNFVDI